MKCSASELSAMAQLANAFAARIGAMTDAETLAHVRNSSAWEYAGGRKSRGKNRIALVREFRAAEVATNLEAAASFRKVVE